MAGHPVPMSSCRTATVVSEDEAAIPVVEAGARTTGRP